MATSFEKLKNKVYTEATYKNLRDREQVMARMELELETIGKQGFAPFFLTYAEMVKICRSLHIKRTPPTVNGPAALVNYCIDSVRVNPLRFGIENLPDLTRGRLGQAFLAIPEKKIPVILEVLAKQPGFRVREFGGKPSKRKKKKKAAFIIFYLADGNPRDLPVLFLEAGKYMIQKSPEEMMAFLRHK